MSQNQSWGLISSIESVTSIADRYFGSAWATQRNHHQDGNEQIYSFITVSYFRGGLKATK